MKNKARSILALLGLLWLTSLQAAVITATIGDDDGFGGTQGASSNPGDAFLVFNTPTIAPGIYSNVAATDVTTVAPWSPYLFSFTFGWDTTGIGTWDSALIVIRSGSVGRRSDGSGFGFAHVSASSGGASVDLGDFLTLGTGAAASALEESVKDHSFDISSLLLPNTTGSLTLTVDGSLLASPLDQFSFDFARLTITYQAQPTPGVPVAEPSSLLLAAAALGVLALRRRKSAA